MIRILVTFLVHRVMLVFVAFGAINFSGQLKYFGEDSLPNIRPLDGVGKTLLLKLDKIPEVAEIRRLMPLSFGEMVRASHSPFLWGNKWLCKMTKLVPLLSLLILSNFLFLFFLVETYGLLTRMVSEDMATAVGIFLVFWPASYEMSLGSGFVLSALLVVMALRAGLDGSWLVAGISSALLTVAEPLGMGLFPVLAYLFFYFQRSYPPRRIVQSAACFFLPAVAALIWRWPEYSKISSLLAGTVFFGIKWTLPWLAQSLTVVFFGAGTVLAMVGAAVWIHRLLPAALFILLIVFSPYADIASRAPMAGICLTGFVGGWKPITRLMQMTLLSLSLQEVFRVFS